MTDDKSESLSALGEEHPSLKNLDQAGKVLEEEARNSHNAEVLKTLQQVNQVKNYDVAKKRMAYIAAFATLMGGAYFIMRASGLTTGDIFSNPKGMIGAFTSTVGQALGHGANLALEEGISDRNLDLIELANSTPSSPSIVIKAAENLISSLSNPLLEGNVSRLSETAKADSTAMNLVDPGLLKQGLDIARNRTNQSFVALAAATQYVPKMPDFLGNISRITNTAREWIFGPKMPEGLPAGPSQPEPVQPEQLGQWPEQPQQPKQPEPLSNKTAIEPKLKQPEPLSNKTVIEPKPKQPEPLSNKTAIEPKLKQPEPLSNKTAIEPKLKQPEPLSNKTARESKPEQSGKTAASHTNATRSFPARSGMLADENLALQTELFQCFPSLSTDLMFSLEGRFSNLAIEIDPKAFNNVSSLELIRKAKGLLANSSEIPRVLKEIAPELTNEEIHSMLLDSILQFLDELTESPLDQASVFLKAAKTYLSESVDSGKTYLSESVDSGIKAVKPYGQDFVKAVKPYEHYFGYFACLLALILGPISVEAAQFRLEKSAALGVRSKLEEAEIVIDNIKEHQLRMDRILGNLQNSPEVKHVFNVRKKLDDLMKEASKLISEIRDDDQREYTRSAKTDERLENNLVNLRSKLSLITSQEENLDIVWELIDKIRLSKWQEEYPEFSEMLKVIRLQPLMEKFPSRTDARRFLVFESDAAVNEEVRNNAKKYREYNEDLIAQLKKYTLTLRIGKEKEIAEAFENLNRLAQEFEKNNKDWLDIGRQLEAQKRGAGDDGGGAAEEKVKEDVVAVRPPAPPPPPLAAAPLAPPPPAPPLAAAPLAPPPPPPLAAAPPAPPPPAPPPPPPLAAAPLAPPPPAAAPSPTPPSAPKDLLAEIKGGKKLKSRKAASKLPEAPANGQKEDLLKEIRKGKKLKPPQADPKPVEANTFGYFQAKLSERFGSVPKDDADADVDEDEFKDEG